MKHWVVTTRENNAYVTRCSCGWSLFTTDWEIVVYYTSKHKENR